MQISPWYTFYMQTPEYFIDNATPWCGWVHTEIDVYERGIIAGTVPSGYILYTVAEVELNYPGIIKTCKSLASIGCDRKFVTHMLKFCIIQADGHDLNTFLERAQLLNKVEAALAIGLSGKELTEALLNVNSVLVSMDLPEDFGLVSEP